MICGKVGELEKIKADEPVLKALRYLKETDFSQVEDGRYDIDGDLIYAKLERYETLPESECRGEAHKKYIDVQFIFRGKEEFGFCALKDNLKKLTEYDEESDVVFFAEMPDEERKILADGEFIVFYPTDIHRPKVMANGEKAAVTKVVVKVAAELMNNREEK